MPYEQYKKEVRSKPSKPTIERHHWHFYRQPIPLSEEDAKKIAAIVTDAKFLKPTPGYELLHPVVCFERLLGVGKLCGGFNADYCFEWRDGRDLYRALLGVNCEEMRIYGLRASLFERNFEIRCDIQHDAGEELWRTLETYREKSPVAAP
jgi:hypothetical protein